MANFYDLVDETVEEFRSDPRNKVFATQALILAGISEETGTELDSSELSALIERYENDEFDGNDEELYDAASYCCGVLARSCFAEDPDDEDAEVDYEISWLTNDDGTISAEIRATN